MPALIPFEFDLALFRIAPPDAGIKPRQIALGDQLLAYRLRRAKRRSIGLTVNRHGLTASAPRWVSIADIEAFIREKRTWVLARLAEQMRRRREPFDWRLGARLPVLDREHEIVYAIADAGIADGKISIAPAMAQSGAALRESVMRMLKTHALDLFMDRVRHFTPRIALPPASVQLSNARARWGSCLAGGRIRLSWRLVHLRVELIDYVVAHELAHLEEMNHSPRFWRVVERLYPDYPAARRELRQRSEDIPEL